MNWFEESSETVDSVPALDNKRHAAYANVFLRTTDGRHVLRDMLSHAGQFDAERYPKEDATTYLILSGFMSVIKKRCGIDDQMSIIDAMAEAGQKYMNVVPEEKEEGIL